MPGDEDRPKAIAWGKPSLPAGGGGGSQQARPDEKRRRWRRSVRRTSGGADQAGGGSSAENQAPAQQGGGGGKSPVPAQTPGQSSGGAGSNGRSRTAGPPGGGGPAQVARLLRAPSGRRATRRSQSSSTPAWRARAMRPRQTAAGRPRRFGHANQTTGGSAPNIVGAQPLPAGKEVPQAYDTKTPGGGKQSGSGSGNQGVEKGRVMPAGI